MHEVVYERLAFSGLEEAIARFEAFARAHVDFEPSLGCERDKSGRRRWVMRVDRRVPVRADDDGEA